MSAIQWTDRTWNPTRGCSRVSEGCRHCYAERVAHRFSGPGQPYEGLVDDKGRWVGSVRLVPEKLGEPLRWRTPRMIFVDSMSDLFHEGVPFKFISAAFSVMAATPWNTYQVLTKRPKRALKWLSSAEQTGRPTWHLADAGTDMGVPSRWTAHPPLHWKWPLPNVWFGVSVENQETADERIPDLLDFPAAVRWVSYEPALGPVDFERIADDGVFRTDALRGRVYEGKASDDCSEKLDWIVVGGESGPGARACDIGWIRAAVRQCKSAGVPVFVKQLGANRIEDGLSDPGHTASLDRVRDRKGGDPDEWPADLRVREWPAERL